MGLPGLTRALADKRYQTQLQGRMRSLASRFRDANAPLPALSTDLPTVTWSSTTPTLPRIVSAAGSEVALQGARGTFDGSLGRLVTNGAYTALDFFLYGSQFEFRAIEQVANNSRFWVFIDGKPIDTAPVLGLTTTAGGVIIGKYVWGASARRRVTIYAAGPVAWSYLTTDWTGSVTPGPPLPKIAFVGDSYFGGSNGSPILQASAMDMMRLLGVDGLNAGVGGSGYITGSDTFGGTSRVASVAAFAPDLIVISGSVNDGVTGLGTAATAAYAAYATACPGVPIIVFGPQPSNATDTISATRAQANAAVKTAATAAPNVIAYIDMVGTAAGTVPPAWASGGLYNGGDLVTYNGSVYKWLWAGNGNSTGPTNPDSYNRWGLVTYMYTGTGTVGATTGNGTRDVLLYSDGVHPTVEGAMSLAVRQSADIRKTLLSI